jgi:hypothetical protein
VQLSAVKCSIGPDPVTVVQLILVWCWGQLGQLGSASLGIPARCLEPGRHGTWQAWNLAGMEPGRHGTWQAWNPAGMEPGRHGTWQAWNLAGHILTLRLTLPWRLPDRTSWQLPGQHLKYPPAGG